MPKTQNYAKKWLALYTRPRWEKKVHALLTEKGIESYCPLNKVRRQWSDRVKTVEEPLFKSYVFVRVNEGERTAVRLTSGAINFIYWNGKPAQIREKEIVAIRKFLDEHEDVELMPMELILAILKTKDMKIAHAALAERRNQYEQAKSGEKKKRREQWPQFQRMNQWRH